MDYIQKHGHGSWRSLPKNAGEGPFFTGFGILACVCSFKLLRVLGFLYCSTHLKCLYRALEVWEELQASVDELPEA